MPCAETDTVASTPRSVNAPVAKKHATHRQAAQGGRILERHRHGDGDGDTRAVPSEEARARGVGWVCVCVWGGGGSQTIRTHDVDTDPWTVCRLPYLNPAPAFDGPPVRLMMFISLSMMIMASLTPQRPQRQPRPACRVEMT